MLYGSQTRQELTEAQESHQRVLMEKESEIASLKKAYEEMCKSMKSRQDRSQKEMKAQEERHRETIEVSVSVYDQPSVRKIRYRKDIY